MRRYAFACFAFFFLLPLIKFILFILLFFLNTDFSTDGKWCYIVLWVVPRPRSLTIDWESLKSRILSVCPSCMISFYFSQQSNGTPASPLYLLKVFCLDRKGLLHGKPKFQIHFTFILVNHWQTFKFDIDVTKVLCEHELTIQRVKVMTTPDGKVLDFFFITDDL